MYGQTFIRVALGTILVTYEGPMNPAYSEDVTPADVRIHPSFNYLTPYENDIALINLPRASLDIIGPTVNTIAIPDDNVGTDGLQGVLSGFSIQEPDFNLHLMFLTAPVMSNAWCSLEHNDRNWIPSKMCVDALTLDVTCIEGNGGPLTANVGGRNTIIGIGALWTQSCVRSHHGVFTRVGSHVAWINSVIGA